jgi:hypothetical protein
MIIINRFGDKQNPVLKGDTPGHPFRGNQYSAGSGGGGGETKASPADEREAMDTVIGDAQSTLDDYGTDDRFEQGKIDEATSKLKEATRQLDLVESGNDSGDAALLSNARRNTQSAAATLARSDDPNLRKIGRDIESGLDKVPRYRP